MCYAIKMITDEILDHKIFSENHDNEEGFYANIERHLNDAGIEFPSFITFEEARPVHEISWTPEKGYVAEGVEGEWASIEKLSDFIERELHHDTSFHESIKGSPDVEDDLGGMVFLKDRENRGSSRMLLSPVDPRGIAVYHYYGFLRGAKAWLENPNDMILAHSFLEHHPVFWYRPRSTAEKRPHAWNMDNGLNSLWTGLSRKENGENVIMFEHGAAVEPDRVMHYHDTRLDIWAPTFEEAYIQLAHKVHQYFYLDGEARPDIPYEPQEWEVEVASRLDKWKETNDKWKDAVAASETTEEDSEDKE